MIKVTIKKGVCEQKVALTRLLFENEPEEETVGEVKAKINRFFGGEVIEITIRDYSVLNRLEYIGVTVVNYEES